ncbi:MAG: hypothetical protein D6735_05520 [Acidobacteria bacterium]|nr:MAG: hypothetical protein D6735_05520 [Acidobacteriota bacterium]
MKISSCHFAFIKIHPKQNEKILRLLLSISLLTHSKTNIARFILAFEITDLSFTLNEKEP